MCYLLYQCLRINAEEASKKHQKRTKHGRRRPGFVTGEPFIKLGSLSTKPARSATTSAVCQRRMASRCLGFLTRACVGNNTGAENHETSNKIVRVKHRCARPSCEAEQVIYHIANKMNRNTRKHHINARFPVSVYV